MSCGIQKNEYISSRQVSIWISHCVHCVQLYTFRIVYTVYRMAYDGGSCMCYMRIGRLMKFKYLDNYLMNKKNRLFIHFTLSTKRTKSIWMRWRKKSSIEMRMMCVSSSLFLNFIFSSFFPFLPTLSFLILHTVAFGSFSLCHHFHLIHSNSLHDNDWYMYCGVSSRNNFHSIESHKKSEETIKRQPRCRSIRNEFYGPAWWKTETENVEREGHNRTILIYLYVMVIIKAQ